LRPELFANTLESFVVSMIAACVRNCFRLCVDQGLMFARDPYLSNVTFRDASSTLVYECK